MKKLTFVIALLVLLVISTSYGQSKCAQKISKRAKKEAVITKASVENLSNPANAYALGTPADTTARIKIKRSSNLVEKVDPLYIVNGKTIVGNNLDLAKINPSDVVSMDVLKDQSAIAIYGDKGINGVVLIITKKAESK